MGGEKAILRHDAGSESEFGNAVRNHIKVGGFLGVFGEKLEKTGIIHTVIVIVASVHIQGRFGHGACADVEHVSQAFADRGIKRFVHVSNALAG